VVNKAMPTRISIRIIASAAAFVCLSTTCRSATAQNDWQAPDPYFGVFQHRDAGTPQAERRYRAEIAPQQPQRLRAHGPAVVASQPGQRIRWTRHRSRAQARR
jgi:hypothetical protein